MQNNQQALKSSGSRTALDEQMGTLVPRGASYAEKQELGCTAPCKAESLRNMAYLTSTVLIERKAKEVKKEDDMTHDKYFK